MTKILKFQILCFIATHWQLYLVPDVKPITEISRNIIFLSIFPLFVTNRVIL